MQFLQARIFFFLVPPSPETVDENEISKFFPADRHYPKEWKFPSLAPIRNRLKQNPFKVVFLIKINAKIVVRLYFLRPLYSRSRGNSTPILVARIFGTFLERIVLSWIRYGTLEKGGKILKNSEKIFRKILEKCWTIFSKTRNNIFKICPYFINNYKNFLKDILTVFSFP